MMTPLQPLSLWTLRTAPGHLRQALGAGGRGGFLVGLGQSVFQFRLRELLFYCSWLLGEQGWG